MTPTQVFIVVLLEYGTGEILVLDEGDQASLPSTSVAGQESSFDAARRAARESLGIDITSQRLIYVIESAGNPVSLVILASLIGAGAGEPDPRAIFVDLTSFDGRFEPSFLREILTEDSASGFYRPTAHVVVQSDAAGNETVNVTW